LAGILLLLELLIWVVLLGGASLAQLREGRRLKISAR
jgi:hypothetical protein